MCSFSEAARVNIYIIITNDAMNNWFTPGYPFINQTHANQVISIKYLLIYWTVIYELLRGKSSNMQWRDSTSLILVKAVTKIALVLGHESKIGRVFFYVVGNIFVVLNVFLPGERVLKSEKSDYIMTDVQMSEIVHRLSSQEKLKPLS